MKINFHLLLLLLLSFFTSTAYSAKAGDLSVTNVIVTSATNNSITYSYTITNTNTFTFVNLSSYKFNSIVSANTVIDGGDILLGIGNLGSGTLFGGQNYYGTFTTPSTLTVNFEQYHNLIVQLVSTQDNNSSNNIAVRDLTPKFADLVVSSLTVSNVKGGNFDFNYTIKNIGQSYLYVSDFYYRMVLSQDIILNAADIQVGTAQVVSPGSTLAIAPGSSYTASGSVQSSISLQNFSKFFLDFKLITGHQQPEISKLNNSRIADLVPAFADLSGTSIKVTHIDGRLVHFDYTITNAGAGKLFMTDFLVKAYLSADGIFDANDLFITEQDLSNTTDDLSVATGGTFTNSFGLYSPVSLESRPFLILQFQVLEGHLHPQGSLSNDRIIKNITPDFADVSVENITINNVYKNTIDFTYTIKNTGPSLLFLTRDYFNLYTSQNNTFELATDLPAGGGLFSDGPTSIILFSGGTYTGTAKAESEGSLEQYSYLIFDVNVIPGLFNPDKSNNNNRFAQNITPAFADLTVNTLAFTAASNNSVSFVYNVSNLGTSELHLDQFYFKTYLSTDNVFDLFDKPAGDSTLGSSVLATNTTAAGSFTASSPGININDYPFLIFVVKKKSGELAYELSYANNQYITSIPVLSFQNQSLGTAYRVEKTADELSITANDTKKTQHAHYSLHTLSGEKISEGDFKQHTQWNTYGYPQGIYVLTISDENSLETIKLFVGE